MGGGVVIVEGVAAGIYELDDIFEFYRSQLEYRSWIETAMLTPRLLCSLHDE